MDPILGARLRDLDHDTLFQGSVQATSQRRADENNVACVHCLAGSQLQLTVTSSRRALHAAIACHREHVALMRTCMLQSPVLEDQLIEGVTTCSNLTHPEAT